MASALSLNAQATIINGYGLNTSANLLAEISTFQSHEPIVQLANVFATISTNSNAAANLIPLVDSVGSAYSTSRWILDLYPTNITPVSSGTVYTYADTVQVTLEPNLDVIVTTTPDLNTAGFSNTVAVQARLPFVHGIQEFANVYYAVYAHVSSVFDTVSSVNLLQNKNYGQSGLGFTGPVDLATNGIRTNGNLLATIVNNWGTMYDINNMSAIGDTYIFGQNLLNQGLGSYGNWSSKLTAAGLNVHNLSAVPQNQTTTTVVAQDSTYSTIFGAANLSSVKAVTTTTVVTGSSTDVIANIYSSVTGSDLTSIIDATGITLPLSSTVNSLNDLLDLRKIVTADQYSQLSSLGISNISSLGTYINSRLNQGYFKDWTSVANTLSNIAAPTQLYTTATASTDNVLSTSTISTLLNRYGQGSGPFNNPTITDFIGAVAGMPYTDWFYNLNQYYNSLTLAGLNSSIQTLNNAVVVYIGQQVSYDAIGGLGTPPDPAPVTAAVAAVNSQLSQLSTDPAVVDAAGYYYKILNQLTTEVNNIPKAHVVFDSGQPQILDTFAQTMINQSTDKVQFNTYNFFANVITDDSYGDIIRAAIAEQITTNELAAVGVTVPNDPNPTGLVVQAQIQNLPISTVIARNQ